MGLGTAATYRTRVFFRWVCEGLGTDEEVRVVGGCDELGSWNASGGVSLTVEGRKKRCWINQAGVLLPLNTTVEYKYAVCKTDTGELVKWEECEGNRVLTPTGLRHIVEDDNGLYRDEDDGQEHVFSPRMSPAKIPSSPKKSSEAISGLGEMIPATSSKATSPTGVDMEKMRKALEFQEKIWTQDTQPGCRDTVFIVFSKLPVNVQKNETTGEWEVTPIESGEHRVLSFLQHFTSDEADVCFIFKVRFIGHPGVYVTDESERKKLSEALVPFSCIPVFMDEEVHAEHLEFAFNFLWPVFHNVKVFDNSTGDDIGAQDSHAFHQKQWKCYQAINNAYAEVIEAHGTKQTLVWVHDYQLLLVTRYLYLRVPGWSFSFFLHCAFPCSDVLQCLPIREEILQSMLSAKLVTFQIFDYSRNFISCCSQLLSANHSFRKGGVLQVEHESRSVVVMTNHFVVPFRWLLQRLDTDDQRTNVQRIRDRFPNKTIIASNDRCDRFAGLTLKLRAFHQFLTEYSQYRNKVVLLQCVSKIGENSQDSTQLIDVLKKMADAINKEFGEPNGPPIVSIMMQEMDGDSRLALLQAADILLDTSINDGLNLTPCMFLCSHSTDKRGIVIVSEFCGCASALTGAYKVNPWDTRKVMRALDEALSVDPREQAERFEKDHSYVSTQSLIEWVTQNMAELKAAAAENRSNQLTGLDAGFQMRSMDVRIFHHLNYDTVLSDYRKAKSRAIFLDYEGTIASKAKWKYTHTPGVRERNNEGHAPEEKVLEYLQTITNDRLNTVVLLSGRKPQNLDYWFSQVNGIGLCAEHGFHWVLPGTLKAKMQAADGGAGAQERWQTHKTTNNDDDWKDVIMHVLKQYVKRVQGSSLEVKNSSITWNYREVGTPALTNQFALELARFLDPSDSEGMMYGMPVKVVHGNGYVEVKRSDVDKGVAVTRTIQELNKVLASPVDFVLCIGDDRSDEDMFEAVNAFFSPQEDPASPKAADSGANTARRRSAGEYPALPPLTRKPSSNNDLLAASPMTRQESGGGRRQTVATTGEDLARKEKMLPLVKNEGNKFYTVTVGRKPSKANFFVKDVEEVTALLQKMASQAIVSSFSRYSSAPDLAGMAALMGAQEDSDSDFDGTDT